MRIIAVCGLGVGTSAILQVNIERVLERLGLSAEVSASGLDALSTHAADAQVVVTSSELADQVRQVLAGSFAEITVVDNYFDLDEIEGVIERSIG